MNFNRLQMWSIKWTFTFLLAAVFIMAAGVIDLNAQQPQRPELPKLSLVGGDNSWDEDWYPDGRIWLPVSSGQPREFLLPVFITNAWHTFPESADKFIVKPTTSFQFSIKYDSSALRAVGVQVFHPTNPDFRLKHNIDDYDPLAKNFNIAWDDFKDYTYKTYLNPGTPDQDKKKGREIRIVGSSTTPLPWTDKDNYKILLYVKFRIEADVNSDIGTAGNTPIYISNDTIKYNDLNISTTAPFMELRPTDPTVAELYPDPGPYTGLAGIDNSTNSGRWNTEPHLPGVIYLRLSTVLPRFNFEISRGIGSIPAITQESDELWTIVDPITVDENSTNPVIAKRLLHVTNSTSTSRMLDVVITSDQPWLKFRTVPVGGSQVQCPTPNRDCYIRWIDNGILADEATRTPTDEYTADDGDVYLEVQGDPNELPDTDGDKTGIHVGYVTFQSPTADVSPVRVKVTFIYFKNPIERNENSVSGEYGIHLNVSSQKDPSKTARLVFGTGERATIGVDPLYGEFAWPSPLREFGARFFPPENAPEEVKVAVSNGFGDYSANDEQMRTGSRDIRSSSDTLQSLTFLGKITTETVSDYPILIEWDTAEFPEDAQLYLRDAVNGQIFNINMRTEGTAGSGTTRTYLIQDPTLTSFVIEYTPGRVIEYVDEFGQPIIKGGWNFLSLPVRPLNTFYQNVYPNAMSKPWLFTQSNYQPEEVLRPGVGYFIKYSSDEIVDTRFAGSFIREISPEAGTPVRIYPGWNTIGTVSTPVSVNAIDFDPFGLLSPERAYTRDAGVFGYRTDRGYYEVTELRPGLGYWIKANNHGYLHIEAPINSGRIAPTVESPRTNILASSMTITVRDNAQRETSLYLTANKNVDVRSFELPPYPMSDMFDVRFKNNANLDNNNTSVVSIQGATYPLSLTMTNSDASYRFLDATTGEILGTIAKGESKSIEIIYERSNSILIEKQETAGFSIRNYPNPVVLSSVFEYNVPVDGNVSIKIYDAVGNEVMILADGFAKAGTYTATLNAANLANGTYICKYVSGSNSTVNTITVVK